MPQKLSPRDKTFGATLVEIVKSQISSEFSVETETKHTDPDPKSKWTIKITVREKTDREKKTEQLAKKLKVEK